MPSLLTRAEVALQSTFGFAALRPHQAEVLTHVLAGRDCMAVLPTGSGKSLCYALPAVVREGLVLVVSPLIALIRDQARRFAGLGVPVGALDSLQTPDERRSVVTRLARGELRLLLVAPERLARQDFRELLRRQPVQLVAVDEAHCISHWGSHFRPDYRLLGDYLTDLGAGRRIQKLALTATATARVRADIVRSLGLAAPAEAWAAFARDNLKTKIVKADRVVEQLAAVLQAVLAQEGSGIVYAPTRKVAADVQRMLRDGGVSAALYHAGLAPAARQAAQRAFMSGAARVVVATHAFGMGVDKADIRFVHHAGLPASLEQYVQEIGRAGRDGLPANCWLVYGGRDYHVQRFMIDKSFPDAALLERVLAAANAFVAGVHGQSPAAVLRHLGECVDAPPPALAEALDVLCREGLLARLTGLGTGEVLIAEAPGTDPAGILRDYPQRKVEMLAKLDAMRTYVGLGGHRLQYLDEYFRQ